MKKSIVLIACLACSLIAGAQAKKPTLMVMPSDAWCYQNGFTKEIPDGEGHTAQIADYDEALRTSMDLKLAIAKINDLMAERGFPLKDLERPNAREKNPLPKYLTLEQSIELLNAVATERAVRRSRQT